MLGNETLLFAQFGGTEITARMQRPRPVAAGEVLNFLLDLDRLHLFDAEDRRAILRRLTDEPTKREEHHALEIWPTGSAAVGAARAAGAFAAAAADGHSFTTSPSSEAAGTV